MIDLFPIGDGAVARLLRAPGFSPAALGPIAAWPAALRRAAQLLLDYGPPAALLWGPGRVLLYNDAGAALLAGRHPAALGRPLAATWPELPAEVGELIAGALAGRPAGVGSARINLLRPEGMTDVSLAVSVTPLRDDGGAFAGLLAAAVETEARLLSPRATGLPAAGAAPKPAARLTVLVVEDEPLVLEAVSGQLTEAGHHVVAATSSEEAVATLAAHAVDVLLTDLNLPGASGAALAATARRLRPEVGIVLATGDARGAAAVAVPHRLLPKPFTGAELVATLAEFTPLPPPEPTVWIAD